MIRPLLAAMSLSFGIPALAAERSVGVGTFDRVRIDGAFDVRIVTGKSPRATLSGDSRALEFVDLRVDGTTLTLRRRSDDVAMSRIAAFPVVVTLSAQTLQSASMLGGGRLAIVGMRGVRADVSVAGTGTISVEGLDEQQANASVVGGGTITLAGRALHLRLSTSGPGSIDASRVVADDLVVRLDGPGETLGQARYLATVSTTGLGRVVVTGTAKCTVRAPAGGAVACGKP